MYESWAIHWYIRWVLFCCLKVHKNPYLWAAHKTILPTITCIHVWIQPMVTVKVPAITCRDKSWKEADFNAEKKPADSIIPTFLKKWSREIWTFAFFFSWDRILQQAATALRAYRLPSAFVSHSSIILRNCLTWQKLISFLTLSNSELEGSNSHYFSYRWHLMSSCMSKRSSWHSIWIRYN